MAITNLNQLKTNALLTNKFITKADSNGRPTDSSIYDDNGNIGIGTQSPTCKLKIGDYAGDTVDDVQVLVSRSANDDKTGHGHAFSDTSEITRTNMEGYGYNCYDTFVKFKGTGGVEHFAGFQDRPIWNRNGTLDNIYGLYTKPTLQSGSITSRFGTYVGDVIKSGGTLAINIGMYVASLAEGVKKWSMYLAGSAQSFIGGALGIGIDEPLDKLQVHAENTAGGEKVAISMGSADFGGTVGDTLSMAWRVQGGSTILGKMKGIVGTDKLDIIFSTYNSGLSDKIKITGDGDIVVLSSSKGIVLKDDAGTPHYWRLTVNSSGVLSTTDIGTTI